MEANCRVKFCRGANYLAIDMNFCVGLSFTLEPVGRTDASNEIARAYGANNQKKLCGGLVCHTFIRKTTRRIM
jgi:hypothetical protein